MQQNERLEIEFCLRGWITPKKILYYSSERKMFLTENNHHELPANVCFQAFSIKRKENDLDRKYRLLGGPAKMHLVPAISQMR